MLGTLSEEKKANWKEFVAPLCHAYNATKHSSTGYAPYFLMFGRNPILPSDVAMQLPKPVISTRTHHKYAEQLREKLEFAHQLAAKHSKERAQHNKHVYDSKAKGNELEPEDRVLVRNVHLRVDVTEDSDTDDQSSWYAVVTRPVPARRSRACLTPEEVPRILKEQEVTTPHATLEEAEHNVSLEERRIPVEPEAVTPSTENRLYRHPDPQRLRLSPPQQALCWDHEYGTQYNQLDDRQDWQHDAKVCHMLT
ncbi:hypothetical protein BSL78_05023 [Apostichopus japonicus]|uniref:Integrase catalytic domain-containing protein n=1 Tax=Stichopus japonicus TaxID=307972 RepID=A0A2G8LCR8_STIJA|nr:hypothetical protein BSL78_05023 [Apostichopus japonicus]